MAAIPFVKIREFTVRQIMPVKNTFIHFDDSSPTCVPLVRSTSCPGWVCHCCCVDGAPTWEGATQALCQAMTPTVDISVSAKLASITRPYCCADGASSWESAMSDSEYFTPDSSPRNAHHGDSCGTFSDARSRKTHRQRRHEVYATARSEVSASKTGRVPVASCECTKVSARRNTKAGLAHSSKSLACVETGRAKSDRLEPPKHPAPLLRESYEAIFNSSAPPLQVMRDWQGQNIDKKRPGALLAPCPPIQQAMQTCSDRRLITKRKNITHKIEVGIEADCGFHVVRRLMGSTGSNIKRIVNESKGAKVWFCCQDAKLPDGAEWVESMGPLMICVSAMSGSSFEVAVELVKELLHTIRREHYDFCREGLANPMSTYRHQQCAIVLD